MGFTPKPNPRLFDPRGFSGGSGQSSSLLAADGILAPAQFGDVDQYLDQFPVASRDATRSVVEDLRDAHREHALSRGELMALEAAGAVTSASQSLRAAYREAKAKVRRARDRVTTGQDELASAVGVPPRYGMFNVTSPIEGSRDGPKTRTKTHVIPAVAIDRADRGGAPGTTPASHLHLIAQTSRNLNIPAGDRGPQILALRAQGLDVDDKGGLVIPSTADVAEYTDPDLAAKYARYLSRAGQHFAGTGLPQEYLAGDFGEGDWKDNYMSAVLQHAQDAAERLFSSPGQILDVLGKVRDKFTGTGEIPSLSRNAKGNPTISGREDIGEFSELPILDASDPGDLRSHLQGLLARRIQGAVTGEEDDPDFLDALNEKDYSGDGEVRIPKVRSDRPVVLNGSYWLGSHRPEDLPGRLPNSLRRTQVPGQGTYTDTGDEEALKTWMAHFWKRPDASKPEEFPSKDEGLPTEDSGEASTSPDWRKSRLTGTPLGDEMRNLEDQEAENEVARQAAEKARREKELSEKRAGFAENLHLARPRPEYEGLPGYDEWDALQKKRKERKTSETTLSEGEAEKDKEDIARLKELGSQLKELHAMRKKAPTGHSVEILRPDGTTVFKHKQYTDEERSDPEFHKQIRANAHLLKTGQAPLPETDESGDPVPEGSKIVSYQLHTGKLGTYDEAVSNFTTSRAAASVVAKSKEEAKATRVAAHETRKKEAMRAKVAIGVSLVYRTKDGGLKVHLAPVDEITPGASTTKLTDPETQKLAYRRAHVLARQGHHPDNWPEELPEGAEFLEGRVHTLHEYDSHESLDFAHEEFKNYARWKYKGEGPRDAPPISTGDRENMPQIPTARGRTPAAHPSRGADHHADAQAQLEQGRAAAQKQGQ